MTKTTGHMTLIYDNEGLATNKHKPIKGYACEAWDHPMIVHKGRYGWQVTDKTTGLMVVPGVATRRRALLDLTAVESKTPKDKYLEAVDKYNYFIERWG